MKSETDSLREQLVSTEKDLEVKAASELQLRGALMQVMCWCRQCVVPCLLFMVRARAVVRRRKQKGHSCRVIWMFRCGAESFYAE